MHAWYDNPYFPNELALDDLFVVSYFFTVSNFTNAARLDYVPWCVTLAVIYFGI